MTTLQIQYWANKEKERNNRAIETETNRHNLAMEGFQNTANLLQSQRNANDYSLKLAENLEKHRSNLANEDILHQQNVEKARSNLAQEQIATDYNQGQLSVARERIAAEAAQYYAGLGETVRSNQAREEETSRSNKAREEEATRSNKAREEETNRHNRQTENLTSDALSETIRHNVHVEDNMRTLAEQGAQKLYNDTVLRMGQMQMDAIYRPIEVASQATRNVTGTLKDARTATK